MSCVEWNAEFKGLLVVAYGEFDFTAQKMIIVIDSTYQVQ